MRNVLQELSKFCEPMNINFLPRYPSQWFPSQNLVEDIGHEASFIFWNGLAELITKSTMWSFIASNGKFINNDNIMLTFIGDYQVPPAVLSTLYINSLMMFLLYFILEKAWEDEEQLEGQQDFGHIASIFSKVQTEGNLRKLEKYFLWF